MASLLTKHTSSAYASPGAYEVYWELPPSPFVGCIIIILIIIIIIVVAIIIIIINVVVVVIITIVIIIIVIIIWLAP